MNSLMKSTSLSVLILVFLFACDTKKQKEGDTTAMEILEEEADEITLQPVLDSPTFPEAKITQNRPKKGAKLKPGSIKFSYAIDNYELSAQTLDADIKNCANSPEGQHIHLILNNEPYTAHYESEFERELEEGHYVALSFLSRSYHESLKDASAFTLMDFTVGDAEAVEVDYEAPHLFYSRPKGEYSGKDTEKLLLDFYLVNTTLSPDGNKVKATINGQEFMITDWKPYFIEGLPLGEVSIELELLDENDEPIEGPFNKVKRSATLKE